MDVAFGFRTHSGWAAVVAIGLSPKQPVVCDRRLIVLADAEILGSKQPFHKAEPMPLPKAEQFLKRCTESTNLLAAEALRDCVTTVKAEGHEVRACGILSASGRIPDSIAGILASHAAIHAAEGEFYRSAIAYACDLSALPLTRVKEKEAIELAAASLSLSPAAVSKTIADLGKQLGPPWSADQKLAALAAWVALVRADSHHRKAAAV